MDSTRASSADASSEQALNGRGRIERLFEMTSELLATISLDGRFTLLNAAWERLLGWSREELQAHSIGEFMHPEDVERTMALLSSGAQRAAQLEHFTNRYRHRDGSWRWLMWSTRLHGDTWYAAARDVTDHRLLERQALRDPLTRLPNRLLLLDRARQALARLHRTRGAVALLFVDLDRFKAVNDNLGHDAGDQLLVAISERLGELMRDSDTVARLGGDEFVILAENIAGESEALALAERALDALERPFSLTSGEVVVLASIGVSVSRNPDGDAEGMLREADAAMYRAKASGGRRLHLFDASLRQELDSRLQLASRLRHAVPREQLLLAYQPILSLPGGYMVGCEALVRWRPDGNAPAGPELLAAAFVPRAAESELIVHIGNWVLHTACVQAERWRRKGLAVPISVNVSARELTEIDLAERVREALADTRLPGRALCLEISEQAVLRDPARARAALKDLKRLGVSIALDNFGSGAFLPGLPTDLPLDMLKLDRVLVQGSDGDRDRRALLAATIALAREAGLGAVAVGIETNRELALVRELECSMGQGFLLHNPAAPDRVRLTATAGALTSAPWRRLVRLGSDGRV